MRAAPLTRFQWRIKGASGLRRCYRSAYSKNQWHIGCAIMVFLTALQWRSIGQNHARTEPKESRQRSRYHGARAARGTGGTMPTAGGRS